MACKHSPKDRWCPACATEASDAARAERMKRSAPDRSYPEADAQERAEGQPGPEPESEETDVELESD